ncbi:HipA domain-containing protein [Pseudomonas sp. NPDC007930]|uniref:type II toxin-antitoxin system HipA family toxin n=1 Tax=Pseudomonas sp. NPDC007930 TaxID=3364417 RepID=UPI0036E547C0
MKVKRVGVSVPQAPGGREVGYLAKKAQYIFDYASGAGPSEEIGIAYPGIEAPFVTNYLQPIFTMNFPEGYLAEKIRQRMAKTPYNDLYVLSLIGDNQIGRLSYSTDEHAAIQRPAQVGLKAILSAPKADDVFSYLVEEYFASGVSGVQPKVLVPDKDNLGDGERKTLIASNLIVKAGLDEYEGLSQNEFLCMEAARFAGLSVPDYYLSDNRELFVMKRFDLEGTSRLGFEDISVLLDIPKDTTGNYKYTQSYSTIADVLAAVCPEDPRQPARFFEYLCLCVMVRNGDAHLKNFGVLYNDPSDPTGRRLSPIYDVTTTSIYPSYDAKRLRNSYDRTMALPLVTGGGRDRAYPDRNTLLEFGRRACMVSNPEAVLERVAEGMGQALRANKDRVERAVFEQLQAEWDMGRFIALNPSTAR